MIACWLHLWLHVVCMLGSAEVTLRSLFAWKCILNRAPMYIFVPKVTPGWPQHDLGMASAWHQHSHRNRGTHTFEPQWLSWWQGFRYLMISKLVFPLPLPCSYNIGPLCTLAFMRLMCVHVGSSFCFRISGKWAGNISGEPPLMWWRSWRCRQRP